MPPFAIQINSNFFFLLLLLFHHYFVSWSERCEYKTKRRTTFLDGKDLPSPSSLLVSCYAIGCWEWRVLTSRSHQAVTQT